MTGGNGITTEDVVFMIAVFGVVAGVWWRVEARIDSARSAAATVAAEFARYQTHVAETYITKQGLREQTEQMMGGIADLKQSLDHLNSRIDSVISQQPRQPQARARSTRQGGG